MSVNITFSPTTNHFFHCQVWYSVHQPVLLWIKGCQTFLDCKTIVQSTLISVIDWLIDILYYAPLNGLNCRLCSNCKHNFYSSFYRDFKALLSDVFMSLVIVFMNYICWLLVMCVVVCFHCRKFQLEWPETKVRSSVAVPGAKHTPAPDVVVFDWSGQIRVEFAGTHVADWCTSSFTKRVSTERLSKWAESYVVVSFCVKIALQTFFNLSWV